MSDGFGRGPVFGFDGLTIRVKKLRPEAKLPVKAHDDDAGFDMFAAEATIVHVGERKEVATGIAVEIPEGWYGHVAPRSGNARKHGITLANSHGVIDAGYRGECICILINHGPQPFVVNVGDRIAQLLILPVPRVKLVEAETLSETKRGEKGFGSTGR